MQTLGEIDKRRERQREISFYEVDNLEKEHLFKTGSRGNKVLINPVTI